ncbi:MAG TPA: DUF5335 family protein [Kofleriaceae bacterium]|nr:DUF5335 family protein [Kofleriaceae bacterium]
MKTLEIPRQDWSSFFDDLSRNHAAETIRVEVLRIDIGAQIEVMALPLDAFAADQAGGRCVIKIAAGKSPADHMAHLISDPQHVRLLRGPSGDDEALEIEAGDDSTTLVYFEGPTHWS